MCALEIAGHKAAKNLMDDDIDIFFVYHGNFVATMMAKHNKTATYINTLLGNQSQYKQTCGMNIRNTIIHDLAVKAQENNHPEKLAALQAKADLLVAESHTPEEHERLMEQLKVHQGCWAPRIKHGSCCQLMWGGGKCPERNWDPLHCTVLLWPRRRRFHANIGGIWWLDVLCFYESWSCIQDAAPSERDSFWEMHKEITNTTETQLCKSSPSADLTSLFVAPTSNAYMPVVFYRPTLSGFDANGAGLDNTIFRSMGFNTGMLDDPNMAFGAVLCVASAFNLSGSGAASADNAFYNFAPNTAGTVAAATDRAAVPLNMPNTLPITFVTPNAASHATSHATCLDSLNVNLPSTAPRPRSTLGDTSNSTAMSAPKRTSKKRTATDKGSGTAAKKACGVGMHSDATTELMKQKMADRRAAMHAAQLPPSANTQA
ncbi:hypothetical protein B0H10DRAFT_1969605 [Mycena sp. CBHHK59/15]|nr:hypothetical protein B0H10DRAFT_1969605 [Mycena sp. CBHHK59/15]